MAVTDGYNVTTVHLQGCVNTCLRGHIEGCVNTEGIYLVVFVITKPMREACLFVLCFFTNTPATMSDPCERALRASNLMLVYNWSVFASHAPMP